MNGKRDIRSPLHSLSLPPQAVYGTHWTQRLIGGLVLRRWAPLGGQLSQGPGGSGAGGADHAALGAADSTAGPVGASRTLRGAGLPWHISPPRAVKLLVVEGQALSRLFQRLMAQYYLLGGGPLCGAQQRCLIRSPRVGSLGALAFSAAAWLLAAGVRGSAGPPRRGGRIWAGVANSRFLLLPSITVTNLGFHVLALAVARVREDCPERYGQTPELLETFVDEVRFASTVYQAANWQRLLATRSPGRQDPANASARSKVAVYVLTLQRDGRQVLCHRPRPVLRLAPPPEPWCSWVERGFALVDLPNGRLRPPLLQSHPQKCGCRLEDRRPGDAAGLHTCLAIDLVVSRRVMDLIERGREILDNLARCSSKKRSGKRWLAIINTPPSRPRHPRCWAMRCDAMRMVAKLGGLLGSTGDGHPGAKVIWRGLNHLSDITVTLLIFYPRFAPGHEHCVQYGQ